MATIDDVAAAAGVGIGTVSRVLNGSPKVSAATRARVESAMASLQYRPSPVARALSRGRTATIGVIVPFFTHASAVERLRGVVAALRDSDFDLVLFDIESPHQREEHLAALTRRDRAAGLLVLSLTPRPRDLARLVEAGVPVVLVDADADGIDVPAVVTDDVEGGRIATRHLVELGHERVAYIGETPDNAFGFTATTHRQQGWAEVLGSHCDPRLVRYCDHDRGLAEEVARELLDRKRGRPTAVFASSDVQATGVLAAAAGLGLQVPEDVSVVGFDDIEIASYAGLTTVRQPLFESGRLGATLLLDALGAELAGGAPAAGTRRHELPLELVVRATTAPPRGGR
jgi:DNA-binding LacI/PurR family transcriptional regulator